MRTLSDTVSRVARSVSSTLSAKTAFCRQRANWPVPSPSVCDAVTPRLSLSQLVQLGGRVVCVATAPPVAEPPTTVYEQAIDEKYVLLVPRVRRRARDLRQQRRARLADTRLGSVGVGVRLMHRRLIFLRRLQRLGEREDLRSGEENDE